MSLSALIVAAGAAFIAAALLMPVLIPALQKLKFGQSIREEGPQSHQKKSGTPTMGGIAVLFAVAVVALALGEKTWQTLFLALTTFGHGFIGFLDDFIKVKTKKNLGLTAKQKMGLQLLLAAGACALLAANGHSGDVFLPGTDWKISLGWLYFPFVAFLLVGATNATNLTDGMDGLLAGTSAIAFAGYAIVASYFEKTDAAMFCAIAAGAVLGFLMFNKHPAKVFMGDTGSLAIGGALAGVAILTKTELLLAVLGGVFVAETLSVIIQVASFKTRKKRVFRMSPLHHHFELGGWSEWCVVLSFWGASAACACAAVWLQIR